jgi:uncharacterized protein YegJ (DUF2314 family)
VRYLACRPWSVAAAAALVLSLAACRNKTESGSTAEAPGAVPEDPYAHVLAEGDWHTIAAREKARVSISGFIDAARGGNPAHTRFQLQTRGPGGKPVWLGNVTYDGHTFKGRVVGPPYQPGTPGAEMKVKREDILDWLYLDGARLVGGFSLHAIRDALPADKRKEFESKLPFRLE